MGRLYKLAYQLRIHLFADAQLDVLARNLAFIAAAIILLQWLIRGRPALPAWHWLTLALILLFAFSLIVLRNAAARADYVVFSAQPDLPAPVPELMAPDDKEATFVSGRFEVEGKDARLANLTAYWRTFGSREHAVMAIQHPSRFAVGSLPSSRIGMWYIFFQPADVQSVVPGTVTYGAASCPGLRIVYSRVPPSDGKKPKKAASEPVYLAFETAAGRDRVWADLLAD
jgi:hypothetical protein